MIRAIVRVALAELLERRRARLRKNWLGRERVAFLLLRFRGEKYRPRMDALESERAKLEDEIKSAKEALGMSEKHEIRLDKHAVYDAAARSDRDGEDHGCAAALCELSDQMRAIAPSLPEDPWDALAELLGAYVTQEARGNADPLAAYDACRKALRTLPSFGEIEAQVSRERGRELTQGECSAIVSALDAVSHGLVQGIGIPFEPPPPPPTKAHEGES